MTLDDLTRTQVARARRDIIDCPASAVQHSADRGDIGQVVDVDTCNGVAFVEFRGPGTAIACTADELGAA